MWKLTSWDLSSNISFKLFPCVLFPLFFPEAFIIWMLKFLDWPASFFFPLFPIPCLSLSERFLLPSLLTCCCVFNTQSLLPACKVSFLCILFLSVQHPPGLNEGINGSFFKFSSLGMVSVSSEAPVSLCLIVWGLPSLLATVPKPQSLPRDQEQKLKG